MKKNLSSFTNKYQKQKLCDDDVDENITFPLNYDDDSKYTSRYTIFQKDILYQDFDIIQHFVNHMFKTFYSHSTTRDNTKAQSNSNSFSIIEISHIIQIIKKDLKGIGLILHLSSNVAPLTLAIAAYTKSSLYAFEVIYK